MAGFRPNGKRSLTVLILCAVVVGCFVFVKQDAVIKSTQNASKHSNHGRDDVTVLGVNSKITAVDTEPVKPEATQGEKIDADVIGIEGHMRDLNISEKIDNNQNQSDEGIGGVGIERHMIDLYNVDPKDLMNQTVIVTAISQNHLKESKGMIGSVQELLPNTRIIMYDLGLKPSGVKEVGRLCNVELRHFDFQRYPPHVKNLHTYAWKPLIIQDTLAEFGVIFWCDASARFRKDPLVLFSLLKKQSGFLRQIVEFQSNKMLVRTHPQMFQELGIDRETFRKDAGYAMCFEANRLLFVNTDLIQTKIIAPWVECALKKLCISPKGSALGQNLKGPVRYTHRFDQAALALVAYKNLRGVWNADNDQSKLFHDVVGLSRSTAGSEKARFCKG